MTGIDEKEPPESRPPFLSRWQNVYVALLIQLAVLVAIFYVIARWAS